MGKIGFAIVVAFACVGSAGALADSPRFGDDRRGGDYGVRGWSQSFVAKPFVSGAIGVFRGAEALTIPVQAVAPFRDPSDSAHRARWLGADADCAFAVAAAAVGAGRRPNCK